MPQQRREEFLLWTVLFIAAFVLATSRSDMISVLPLLLLFVGLAARFTIHIVKEYERLVILRVGRYIGVRGPGLVFVIPFVDTALLIDTRVKNVEVPHESCITKDNARIDVDFLLYYKISQPQLAITRVQNLPESLNGLATALLRAVIGAITLDEALAKREHINQELQAKIDEVTETWGVEITTVEIREIVMPPETQEIMTKQMAAERTKRAMILEAEGYKEAAMLKAQGDATALEMLHDAAEHVDLNTLNLKYFDTLRSLGESQSTKYIFPMDFLDVFRSLLQGANGSGGDGGLPRPASIVEPPRAQADGSRPAAPPGDGQAAPSTNGHAPPSGNGLHHAGGGA